MISICQYILYITSPCHIRNDFNRQTLDCLFLVNCFYALKNKVQDFASYHESIEIKFGDDKKKVFLIKQTEIVWYFSVFSYASLVTFFEGKNTGSGNDSPYLSLIRHPFSRKKKIIIISVGFPGQKCSHDLEWSLKSASRH